MCVCPGVLSYTYLAPARTVVVPGELVWWSVSRPPFPVVRSSVSPLFPTLVHAVATFRTILSFFKARLILQKECFSVISSVYLSVPWWVCFTSWSAPNCESLALLSSLDQLGCGGGPLVWLSNLSLVAPLLWDVFFKDFIYQCMHIYTHVHIYTYIYLGKHTYPL